MPKKKSQESERNGRQNQSHSLNSVETRRTDELDIDKKKLKQSDESLGNQSDPIWNAPPRNKRPMTDEIHRVRDYDKRLRPLTRADYAIAGLDDAVAHIELRARRVSRAGGVRGVALRASPIGRRTCAHVRRVTSYVIGHQNAAKYQKNSSR
ncbi:hypothetical protein EVAR_76754_1 [Eumeta japonica]|uniref:Uncharacterized protein n=1 Tax=Eumeta variegata TaxID=151549 RepID=A0A4C1STN0_EUMVA|nr:hypothetical protein EVAR_76754_1 [Eumeta japonica]